MKGRPHFKFKELREKFRLTYTEKRVAVFVLAAFMLGLVTKCYRDAQSPHSPAPAKKIFGRARPLGARNGTDGPAVHPYHL
ncbi:MAG: hypothetical protein DME33_03925 [Verrucomicrobia bacterium]|nr:MAG: hypothetical protein DME33_03925 [Verrucomicrobiota bacterium]